VFALTDYGLGNGKPNSRFRKMRKADRARRPT
jgi:hypothetical protein